MKSWCMLSLITILLVGCDAKLPEFAAVYVLQNGAYKEVIRVKDNEKIRFNSQYREGLGYDYNEKAVIPKDKFTGIDQDTINKKGFLVVQKQEWSEVKLFRAIDVEGHNVDEGIITEVKGGGGAWGGSAYFPNGLIVNKKLTEVDLKQAKKGENAFFYVPSSPLERGYYLINYKGSGEERGYHPIVVN